MSMSLSACGRMLTAAGIRHHVDSEEAAIWVLFVTRHYTNARGEKLAIVRLEAPDDGRRLRASIARVISAAANPAASCLALCRLAAETPLVGVEYDATGDDLRLVVETAVEDGRLTKRQVFAAIDALVGAADAWHAFMGWTKSARGRRPAA